MAARAVLPALHVEPLRSSSVKTLGVIATLRAEACGGAEPKLKPRRCGALASSSPAISLAI